MTGAADIDLSTIDLSTIDLSTIDLSTVDLSDTAFWTRPPAERHAAFAALRRDAPFTFYAEPEFPFFETGPGYYAIVRHADVEAVSSQPDLFCSGKGAISILDMPADLQEFYGSLISMDSPRHSKIRRILSRAFTPRMLDDVVANVETTADGILAGVRERFGDGRPFDLVAEISAPLPLLIICDMMGIPEDRRQFVFDKTNVILSGGDPEFVGTPEEAVGLFLEAGAGLSELMNELAAERAGGDGTDLVSTLLKPSADGETLTHQELASFFILLCVAGNETTRNAITHGVHALSLFPDERAAWMADPEGLSRTGVEEIVRWATPVTWMRRTATRDVELAGRQFSEGDKMVLFYGSANRDETVFTDPYRFDVRRDPNPHVGFGARGPHFCLGAHLARREVTVMFRKLFAQLPELTVAGEPDYLESSFVNGVKRLPVALART